MRDIRCLFGLHRWTIPDWNAIEGRLRCNRCGHEKPMTGKVLWEWIKYRNRRVRP